MKGCSGAFVAVIFAGALTTSVDADTLKKVDIITMVDTPQLIEVKDGLLQGLKEHGYIEGETLKVDFKSDRETSGLPSRSSGSSSVTRPTSS
jgi:ABC-type uncharacterized transport system substrate-binding protein